MRTIIISAFVFLAHLSFCQSGDYFVLLFDGAAPTETVRGYEYKLKDILEADSISCNAEYWKVAAYKCMSVCEIDWEYHSKSNKLTEQVKKYIEGCCKYDGSKLYFFDIILEDPTGRKTIINEFEISLRL